MVYQAGLITAIMTWVLVRTGVFPRFIPHVEILGAEVGFYAIHLVMFLLVAFVIWLVDTALPARWFINMRSHQGTSRFLDWLILILAFAVLSTSLGAGTVGPYLILVLLIASFGALESLIMHPERAHLDEILPVPVPGPGEEAPAPGPVPADQGEELPEDIETVTPDPNAGNGGAGVAGGPP